MDDITFNVGMVMLVLILMNTLKMHFKQKKNYPLMVFIISFVLALFFWFVQRDAIIDIVKNGVIWGSGAIASYDLIIEKIENFVKRNKDEKCD
jgi:hypothetical protein